MSWFRIFIILVAVGANITIICYDFFLRDNSLIRKLKIHKIFSAVKAEDNIEEVDTTDYLSIEIRRVIDNLRRKYGVVGAGNASRQTTSFQRKVVLQYTAVFGRKPWPWMKNTEEFNHWHGVRCPYYSCELVFDRRERPRSDALLFHSRDMPDLSVLNYIEDTKKPHQRWVYFSKENPMNNPTSRRFDLIFNWTLTYKRDSDIFIPYGYYFPVQRPRKLSAARYLRGKEKLVFWTSSHCGLPRDDYVRELLKYIKVDVIGACARPVGTYSLICPKNNKACEERLKSYKFQLAFENTNCVDYITEKYWHSLKHGIVPVVMGGADYTADIAIPGSYINVIDFSSVKELADYLNYLDRNDTAYQEYFKWNQNFMTTTYSPWNCILCARLYLDNTPKVYKRLDTFWGAAENCGKTETDKMIYRMKQNRKNGTRTN